MSEVIPLRGSDTTPEMLLREILSQVGEIEDICIVLSTKDQTKIAMCGNKDFMFRASLCLNDLSTHYATGRLK